MLKIMKASAGSGKTYSLARTYISLLLKNNDRYAYRHILAVTFTNKATDEMKRRILKELHILATDTFSSDYLKDFVPSLFASPDLLQQKARAVLHDILHDYSAFAVSTIDRFFQHTLKAFAREIGQFASYQVELDKDSLVAESVDRILDSLTEEDSGLLSWLTRNVLEQIEKGERYSMDANLLQMALRLKSAQRQEALEKAGIRDEENSKEKLLQIRDECRRIISSFKEEARVRATAVLEALDRSGVRPEESNYKFMTGLYAFSDPDPSKPFEAPKDTFMKRAVDRNLWFAKSRSAKLLPQVEALLEDPMKAFCELWGRDFQIYNTACVLDSQIYGLGVAAELQRTYKDLMKEKNVLSIDDSNTILKDIIDGSDAPFVYEKLGVRYDHFLLDEFQDTAGVQWTNFSPLLHNSDSQGGENLIVGDVKQSIYRWRGSDWNLFDSQIPNEFPGHVNDPLKVNYRSLGNIVRFNNEFFRQAAAMVDRMSGHGDNGPLSAIYKDVEQGIHKKDKAPGNVSVTFCAKEDELQRVLDAVMEARSAGARLSEIAVLVRSNAIGENVALFLIDNGIDVITDDSLKVKNAITVRRLASLMSYVDNPDNSVSSFLAASLDVKVPEGCTSLVDLAESLLRGIKESDKDMFWKSEILHVQSFMDKLSEYVSAHGNSLRGFLKYWEGEDPSISSPSSGECVRVMTIHKSKGLDFPYVIVPYVENIKLFKADSYWCAPDLKDTSLEGIAEGVYDVTLSSSSKSTLFADHYDKESFLQQVDNINTLYVAMTRASAGMHVIAQNPSDKWLKELEDADPLQFSDFSQVLYWFVCHSDYTHNLHREGDEEHVRFDLGGLVDFDKIRKQEDDGLKPFVISSGDEYPSIPLNPESESDQGIDVRERGRLKFSADALEFFSDEGMDASNRVRGVVLHDVLAMVICPEDLEEAVSSMLTSGTVTSDEARRITGLLSEKIAHVRDMGWFDVNESMVLNETSLMDSDGQVYRPDRVVMDGRKVKIVDYKFGEHHRSYERQLTKYADLWERMGYQVESACLWYVLTDEIVKVR